MTPGFKPFTVLCGKSQKQKKKQEKTKRDVKLLEEKRKKGEQEVHTV